jgi:hypothetical protein
MATCASSASSYGKTSILIRQPKDDELPRCGLIVSQTRSKCLIKRSKQKIKFTFMVLYFQLLEIYFWCFEMFTNFVAIFQLLHI